MYNSPIKLYEAPMKAIIEERENAIFAKIQDSFDVDVDKAELIRALQYDRGQYDKGYRDGKAAVKQEWIPVSERLPEVIDQYIVVVKLKYDWEKEYEIGVDVATYDPYSGNPYIDGCWNTYNDWNEGQDYLHVTHWMPMPEAPKEDDV